MQLLAWSKHNVEQCQCQPFELDWGQSCSHSGQSATEVQWTVLFVGDPEGGLSLVIQSPASLTGVRSQLALSISPFPTRSLPVVPKICTFLSRFEK